MSLSGNVLPSTDKGAIEEIWSGTICTCKRELTLHGRSALPRLSTEGFRPWFPQGKDTADLVLLKVETTWGEYWDSVSGEKSTLDLIGSAAKKLLGTEEKATNLPEDHAKVSLTAPTRM